MSIDEEHGQKAPTAPANGLRRRVIFELDPGQLPLLEKAKERHGSTRAALIAALGTEAEAQELRDRLKEAEERLAKAERSAARQRDKKAKGGRHKPAPPKPSERERKLLAELESARKVQAEEAERSRRELGEYAEALEERDVEIAELGELAVDWLFCARCGDWVPPEGWVWQDLEDGGSYAFHGDCGDHKPGLVASSRLASRDEDAP